MVLNRQLPRFLVPISIQIARKSGSAEVAPAVVDALVINREGCEVGLDLGERFIDGGGRIEAGREKHVDMILTPGPVRPREVGLYLSEPPVADPGVDGFNSEGLTAFERDFE